MKTLSKKKTKENKSFLKLFTKKTLTEYTEERLIRKALNNVARMHQESLELRNTPIGPGSAEKALKGLELSKRAEIAEDAYVKLFEGIIIGFDEKLFRSACKAPWRSWGPLGLSDGECREMERLRFEEKKRRKSK